MQSRRGTRRSRAVWVWAGLLAGVGFCAPAPADPIGGDAGGAGPGTTGSPGGEPLRVAASLFPLGDIAACIGGDAVRVQVLLPVGATPHGYEPTPTQAEQLAGADLLLVVGLGVDPWAEASAAASGNRRLALFSFADAVLGDGEPFAATGDPHLWLDPVLAARFAEALAADLERRLPERADSLRARSARYQAALAELDREHHRRLSEVPDRRFVALHPAFSRLAERYGLTQLSIYDAHMHEPGPHAMEEVLRAVREQGVRAVFSEPQMSAASLDWLREQAGVSTGVLDPLGNPARPGYDGYLELMRSNLDELVRGLGGADSGR